MAEASAASAKSTDDKALVVLGKAKGARPTYSTRVFKKSSPNGKITAYVGRRDFFDDGYKVDVVDGVVLIDPEYIHKSDGRKVFGQLKSSLTAGREASYETQMIGAFTQDLLTLNMQIYPPNNDRPPPTKLQQRLMKKLGENAYPFQFVIPARIAASVTLQKPVNEATKYCGVEYLLQTFVATSAAEKIEKRNSVHLAIKKLMALDASLQKEQPQSDAKKSFWGSSYPVSVEARLDKYMYFHGDPIVVHLNIDNRSNKTIKSISITVKQVAEIVVLKEKTKCVVTTFTSENGFPINPSSHLSQSYSIVPSLEDNRHKTHLAVDGQLKHEDTNLASSTDIRPDMAPQQLEEMGIIVKYVMKVKLHVQFGTDIKLSLGFGLTHCRPADDGLMHQVVETRAGAGAAAATSAPAPATEESAADHYTLDPTRGNHTASAASAAAPARGNHTASAASAAAPAVAAPPAQPPQRAEPAVGDLINLGEDTAPAPRSTNPFDPQFGAPAAASIQAGVAHGANSFNEFVEDDDIHFEEFVRLRTAGETDA